MSEKVMGEIIEEQEHGREKYGGDAMSVAHDDLHTDGEWTEMIRSHLIRAEISPPMERRQYLIKLAGLAKSAVEAFDRRSKAKEEKCQS